MFGADGRRNDRADRKLATFDRGVLERAEKRRRANNASVSEMKLREMGEMKQNYILHTFGFFMICDNEQ